MKTLCLVGLFAVVIGLSWVDGYHHYYNHNVAQDKPSWQSSVLSNTWFAGRANDGGVDPRFEHFSCAHTNLDEKNWWVVDLLDVYDIIQVVVYNRGLDKWLKSYPSTHHLAKFEIQAGPTLTSMKRCAYHGGLVPLSGIKRLRCIRKGVRFVRLLMHRKGYLEPCEVKVLGHPSHDYDESLLISNHKPAAQSSTLTSSHDASKAVDGNPQPISKTLAHTNLERSPWWRVDLKHNYHIDRIVVYNRDGHPQRLNGLQIDTKLRGGKYRMYNYLKAYPVSRDIHVFRHFNLKHPKARFVKVWLPFRKDYLQLCEVRVYGWLA